MLIIQFSSDYVYFTLNFFSDFLWRLNPLSKRISRKESEVNTNKQPQKWCETVTTNPIPFITDDSQKGILVTDGDMIEGFEFRTVISLFAKSVLSLKSPASLKRTTSTYFIRKSWEETQINLVRRAVANLIIIEDEDDEG